VSERFAEVGDIVTINRRRWRITKVNDLGQDCYSYNMERVSGIGAKWLGTGKRLTKSGSKSNATA
jgi:hypothetical protein